MAESRERLLHSDNIKSRISGQLVTGSVEHMPELFKPCSLPYYPL